MIQLCRSITQTALAATANAQRKEKVTGLTKREYFAALAMQGLLASPTLTNEPATGYALRSRAMADALIEELNKEQNNA